MWLRRLDPEKIKIKTANLGTATEQASCIRVRIGERP